MCIIIVGYYLVWLSFSLSHTEHEPWGLVTNLSEWQVPRFYLTPCPPTLEDHCLYFITCKIFSTHLSTKNLSSSPGRFTYFYFLFLFIYLQVTLDGIIENKHIKVREKKRNPQGFLSNLLYLIRRHWCEDKQWPWERGRRSHMYRQGL